MKAIKLLILALLLILLVALLSVNPEGMELRYIIYQFVGIVVDILLIKIIVKYSDLFKK